MRFLLIYFLLFFIHFKIVGQISVDSLIGKNFVKFEHQEFTTGKSFSNKDFIDKTVLINFWFTNCAPCIAEMNSLNKLYDSLKEDKHFIFISFSFDDEELLRKTLVKHKIKYPVLRVSKDESKRLNFSKGYPTTIILDKKGIVRYFTQGGEVDEAEASAFIKEILVEEIAKIKNGS